MTSVRPFSWLSHFSALFLSFEGCFCCCFVIKTEKIVLFLKKVPKMFGGFEKTPYLCIRFREKSRVTKKEIFEKLT